MRVKQVFWILVAVLVLFAAPFGSSAEGPPEATPANGTFSFELTGEVSSPGIVTVADLKALSTQSVEVVFVSGQGEQAHSYTGVLLIDLITDRELVVDADAKNDKLAKYIVATGADGYEAVIAFGEIDPDFGNQPILVAYEEDGESLGSARLVVPGDVHGGRYVSEIVSIEVRDVDSEPRS
jgi:DMSO/TMAO reductase YedYZ molybdopterin-dependent catalytic subunit